MDGEVNESPLPTPKHKAIYLLLTGAALSSPASVTPSPIQEGGWEMSVSFLDSLNVDLCRDDNMCRVGGR